LKIEIEKFYEARRQAGLAINLFTAEVWWEYGQVLDPYGLGLDLPEEARQIGRNYFARAPGSDIWVEFNDLPDATLKALRLRIDRGDFDRDDDMSWLLDDDAAPAEQA
jgi:hypothetical protein